MKDFVIDFLDHVAIRVRDLKKSADWYSSVLGLKIYKVKEWGEFPVFLMSGKSGLALFPADENDPVLNEKSRNVKIDHFAFNVSNDNYEKALMKFKHMGIEFKLMDHHFFKSVYINDPDGHIVELTTIQVPGFYSSDEK